MRYKITVEFSSDYIPSDIMDLLAGCMVTQLESIHDGTLPTEDLVINYDDTKSEWFSKAV
jgi:hypothetical protein